MARELHYQRSSLVRTSLICGISIFSSLFAFADAGLYEFPHINNVTINPQASSQPDIPTSTYAKIAAEYFKTDAKTIQALLNIGYTQTQVMRLLVLTQMAEQKFEDIAQAYRDGAWLSKLAQQYNLDYKLIKHEARRIKRILRQDARLQTSKNKSHSRPTAGVDDPTSKGESNGQP